MSARDVLIAVLNEEHNPSYSGDAPRDAVALVNAYAHELAEKIRHHDDWVNDDDCPGFPVGMIMNCGGCDYSSCHELANLIDPGASE
jgi:hypothetical protein